MSDWQAELSSLLSKNHVPRGCGPGLRYDYYEHGKYVIKRWREKIQAKNEWPPAFEICMAFLADYLKA